MREVSTTSLALAGYGSGDCIWLAGRFEARLTGFRPGSLAIGFGGVSKLLPATFLVIVGAVAIYGLAAAPLAKTLGLSKPETERHVGEHPQQGGHRKSHFAVDATRGYVREDHAERVWDELQGRGELSTRLARPESGQDQPVTLTAVNAISDMVAPVVLLTVGGMLSNGLITIYSDVDNRMRDMTRERLEIRRGPAGQVLDTDSVPAIDQERLTEIGIQLPLLQRRHRLTRLSVLTIYVALVVLGLSIVVIGLAVALEDEIVGRIALGLVLAGTIIELLGLGVAVISLAKSADAITYAVKRTTKFG